MFKLFPLIFKASRGFKIQNRTFLSDTFRLQNDWDNRLSSHILKKINVNDMFYELDNQFQHFANASAIDIDLFINAVDDDSSFDEVEDVVHKFRLSPEAVNILPSTHHALIRLYMKSKKTKDLIRILDDRLNYGIFPDDYCTLMMMDTFIKEGNFKDAARVSTFSMLQEEIPSPLIKFMSLYSCHKYLENPVAWTDPEIENPEPEDDDDEEEIKVRVKYIRNPYFDDHFDLVDPKMLIGKTMNFIGATIDDCIGRTYKLIGLILYDELSQANEYLLELSSRQTNAVLVKDGLTLAKNILNDKSYDESVMKSLENQINSLKNSLDKSMSDSQLVTDDSLLVMVEQQLKELVKKEEPLEINKQLEIYKHWEVTRENLLMEQLAMINKQKQLAEIQRQKQLLEAKEEELFFFDNEDKIDLIIEEKEKRKEEQRERERIILEAKMPKKKEVVHRKKVPINPPLNEFIDENIPMKLIKTKL